MREPLRGRGRMLSREQAQALARAVHLLRPAWNEEGVFAALGKVQDRDAYEVALAALRAAQDDKCRTPGVIPSPGPHWNEAPPKELEEPAYLQPEKGETCSTCYMRRDVCRSRWAKDHEYVPLTHASAGRTLRTEEARAELAAATATACRHGIVRERVRCAECEKPAPAKAVEPA